MNNTTDKLAVLIENATELLIEVDGERRPVASVQLVAGGKVVLVAGPQVPR